MNRKSIVSKFVIIALLIAIIALITANSAYAANYNLDVNCNGKTIKMTSNTPNMTWNITNLLPGESEETTLTIANVGTKKVDVSFKATIENGTEVANILDIKIIKLANNDTQSEDEKVFEGKCSDLKSVNLTLEKGKKQSYKIITYLPKETGNEFQEKECVVKFDFTATGKQDTEPPKEIITEEVKPPQTGETYAIYIIAGILGIAVIALVVSFIVGKKKENEKWGR